MGLFIKVLEIKGLQTESIEDSYGECRLYPKGTKRIIKKLTLKGYKIYTQEADIKTDFDILDPSETIYYNTWKTIKN